MSLKFKPLPERHVGQRKYSIRRGRTQVDVTQEYKISEGVITNINIVEGEQVDHDLGMGMPGDEQSIIEYLRHKLRCLEDCS